MRYSTVLMGSMAVSASAYPAVMEMSDAFMQKRALEELSKRQLPTPTAAQALSKARGNCGVVPCLVFDEEEQFVSTTGQYAYASPAADEIRGPCPGLNAAANHGYIPRSGVVSITETITGLGSMYGMSPDLAGFLAAYAIIFDGDPITGTWSIGGPQEASNALLGKPQGISYSHNVYEGDTSIARPDAYLNHGDAHSLDISRFRSAYAATASPDRYTLDSFAQNFNGKVTESIATNPYYFAAPFSTTLVSPAAYNFVINFMSNHTADNPNGYLDGNIFKTFFGITGDTPANFKWLRGQERAPDNWYRRTSTNQYNAANVFTDLAPQFLAYPNSFRLGGNTNGVNTYAGVDLGDLTGGAFNFAEIFDPSNNGTVGACYFSSLAQALIPDLASVPLQLVTPITNLINQHIKTIVPSGLDCPLIDAYDQTLFNKYPGHTYSPTGPATNY